MSHQPRSLQYSSTIDRAQVHKNAISEVFLTDTAPGEGCYLFAAQLPNSHSYFNDHPGAVDVLDPLAVVEACRQAETMLAHTYLGVAPGVRFLLHEWAFDFRGLASAEIVAEASSAAPVQLLLEAKVLDTRTGGGRLRAGRHRIDVSVVAADGRSLPVGDMTFRVSYVTPETYAALRSRSAGEQRPADSNVISFPSTVAPELVGRTVAANVVLSDVVTREGALRALLRLPFENRSMFDHEQDHVPGMVLMEAARQAGALQEGPVSLACASAEFPAYTELDSPVEIECDLEDDGTLTVRTIQAGTLTSRITVTSPAQVRSVQAQSVGVPLDRSDVA